MKRRRVVAIIAVLLLLGWLAQFLARPKEPGYQGKTLTKWLQKYEADRTEAGQVDCEKVINAIGTNAIPALLKLLTANDLPGAASLQAAVEGLGWKNVHAFDATYKRRLATLGFQTLGQTAKSATPKLIELAQTSHSPLTRQYALWCLEQMKNGREILVPVLTQSLGDSDQETAKFAAERLYQLAPETAKKAGADKLLPYLSLPATNTPASKQK
ncbi:MAG TPA: hypothetical protein VFC07_07890 [Verrucomicrobiae bacterium]|nr:hypothetical protein [Verrucomicrobiae bacterium]